MGTKFSAELVSSAKLSFIFNVGPYKLPMQGRN